MVGNLDSPGQHKLDMWYMIFTSHGGIPRRKKTPFEVSLAVRSPAITIHPDPCMAIAKFSEGRMQSERMRQLVLAVLENKIASKLAGKTRIIHNYKIP